MIDEDDTLRKGWVGYSLFDFGVVFIHQHALAGDGGVDISIGIVNIGHLKPVFLF